MEHDRTEVKAQVNRIIPRGSFGRGVKLTIRPKLSEIHPVITHYGDGTVVCDPHA